MRQTQNASKKDNRKSILVIGLLLLLVAVIGFGGYTLSKYVTKKSVQGNATVAKWGLSVKADESKMFGSNYKFETANSVVTADNSSLTVKASSADRRLVAPGTTGSMDITIEGTAEVAAEITFGIKDGYQDVVLAYNTDKKYNPIKWTLKKDGTAVTNGTNVTLAALVGLLKNEKITYTAAGTAPTTKYTIEWVWNFEVDDATNALDTLLANYANDNKNTTDGTNTVVAADTHYDLSFELVVTIAQLQKVA
mgnify:CR=1 FL=1